MERKEHSSGEGRTTGTDRRPTDTLDREPRRTPGGMPVPDDYQGDGTDTPGGQPPEKVEDRPGVSKVKPEDYPDPARMPPD